MSNENDEKLFLETAEDTVSKVRLAGMRAGAKGVAGAVLEICNDKAIKNDTVRINKIRDFCAIGLGLKK